MANLAALLYRSPKTVLTTRDLNLLWQEANADNLKSKIAYYVKTGVLRRLRRGVFAKEKKYDLLELGTSIYTPSYISFETVLRQAGVIFQHYETIFIAGPWPRTLRVDGHALTFRKLKDSVLYNAQGIENMVTYSIASPERAFLDMLYLFPTYHFDNLRPLRQEKCVELASLYGNRQLIKRVIRYFDTYAQ